MTAADLPLPAGFTAAYDDVRHEWRISRDGVHVGTVFPVSVPYPEGRWFARLPGRTAQLFNDKTTAVDHVVGHATEESR